MYTLGSNSILFTYSCTKNSITSQDQYRCAVGNTNISLIMESKPYNINRGLITHSAFANQDNCEIAFHVQSN